VRSKTRWLFPSEKKSARFRASLFSPSERNHARSALKRFSHAQALAQLKKGKLSVSLRLARAFPQTVFSITELDGLYIFSEKKDVF
jgi:hypothetical protein